MNLSREQKSSVSTKIKKIFKRDAYEEMLEWKKRRDLLSGPGSHALEIRGPRQCGKTTLINQFASENYKQITTIHLGDDTHQKIKNEWLALSVTENFPPSMHKHERIYNLLRRFNDKFEDKKDSVIVIDEIQECPDIHRLVRTIAWEFESHLIVSGSYLNFTFQSKQFFLPAGAVHTINLTPLTFIEFLDIFDGRRKLYEQIDVYAISWLKGCGIIGYSSKINECKFNDRVEFSRYYFMDLGIANLFVKGWAQNGLHDGILAESFAYLQLCHMIPTQNLVPDLPAFGTYKNGEIDFILFNLNGGTSYGIEVKSGRSSSNTAEQLLADSIVDYIVYAKGNTKGGKTKNTFTIPLMLLGRFKFEDFTGNSIKLTQIPQISELLGMS